MEADFVGWENYEEPEEFDRDTSNKKDSVKRVGLRSGSLIDRLKRFFRITKEDPELEEFETHSVRYVPSSLEALQKTTRFSRHELQLIYRGFKQDCPTGIVSAEKFRELYSQFFPLGDATVFARHIFQTMDHDADGLVNFDEFIVVMSVLDRGSIDEKLQWIFNLYDTHGDGRVSLDNMIEIGTSVYELMGKHTVPPINEFTVKQHIARIFNVSLGKQPLPLTHITLLPFKMMDTNQDGLLTFEEFKEACINNENIRKNLTVFNTFF